MAPLFLILIPLLSAFISFLLKENYSKIWSIFSSTATLGVVITIMASQQLSTFDAAWMPSLGSRFTLKMDGMSKMLCLLTAISFPVVFTAIYKNIYKNSHLFFGLMLLTQAGLMGVFLAADCLLFYIFWELALIPVYFLCSIWGGEKRIAVTFKFFIYTFFGSLLMLIGILYLYKLSPDSSFSIESFYAIKLTRAQQTIGFWLFFIAFAIKMPIFPLHTWQPDAYEQSPTGVTMILSGVMVKMGVFAVVRWLIPIFPLAVKANSLFIVWISIVGMLYASIIAIKQDDAKRLIAYSSIGHIGLMCAAIFTGNSLGLSGVMIQMFNHGVNVIGLWIVADAIEQQFGTRKLSELGGIAKVAPELTILFVVLGFANIALPLTNAFVGEFLMFNGLFQYNYWIAGIAGLSIILAAVYTLNMVQKVFYGDVVAKTVNGVETPLNVRFILVVLVVMVIGFGVFPQPFIDLTSKLGF